MTRVAYGPARNRGARHLARLGKEARSAGRGARADFESVRLYCLFAGYARSGSSLVGSLLDAHPRTLVTHELDVLGFVSEGFDRDQLVGLSLANAREFGAEGREWTGYSYAVPGQWQGRFERLEVLGDKKAGRSVRRLIEDPGLLDRLAATLRVPVRVVHVVRNPYDNITTRHLRRGAEDLGASIDSYFALARGVADLRERLGPGRCLDLRHEDVIAEPRAALGRLLDFLTLDAPADYLQAAASIVFASPSRTRSKIEWPDASVREVAERAAAYEFLADYRFEE